MRLTSNDVFDLILMDLNYARDTTSGQEGLDLLAALKSVDFADLCITSGLQLTADPEPPEAFRLPEMPGLGVVFEPAIGDKCERCWNYREAVGKDATRRAGK